MRNKISCTIPGVKVLILIMLLLCATLSGVAEETDNFTGDWQLRYFRTAGTPEQYATNPSYYHLEVTMTLNENGEASMTEIQDGKDTVINGTWTSEKKNECTVSFENLDTLKFRLKKGVLTSYGGREVYTFTQHDTEGEMSLGLPVDAWHFPDAGFRQHIIDLFGYIKNYTPYLDQKQIREVKELYLSGKDIRSLEGIRYFTELTTLNCEGLQLQELDVSGMAKLKTLSCAHCGLEKLKISECKQLSEVDCSSNLLKSLDASGLPMITKLRCCDNKLETLLLRDCSRLNTLICHNNSLKILDLTGLQALTTFYYPFESLEELTLTNCRKLETVDCAGNKLTRLDLSGTTSLKELECSRNRLKTLDLGDCKALNVLHCSDNELEALDLEKNRSVNTLDCSRNPTLMTIRFGKNNRLSIVDLMNTALTELDITGCPRLQKLAQKKDDGSGYQLDRTNGDESICLYLNPEKVRVIVNTKITVEPGM